MDDEPLLHSAEPGGEDLAEHICSMAKRRDATPAEAWAALTCLQYASADAERVGSLVAVLSQWLCLVHDVGASV